jgi:hypothetical protein
MGLQSEQQESQVVEMESRPERLSLVKADGSAGEWGEGEDGGTTMVVPTGNAHTMDECKRMRRWLENMHQNITVLATKYEKYCLAMETVSDLAKDLGESVSCFESFSKTATIFKDVVLKTVENQQSIFSESRGKLEDMLAAFWVSPAESLGLQDGSFQKNMNVAATNYCVTIARALAVNNKVKAARLRNCRKQ